MTTPRYLDYTLTPDQAAAYESDDECTSTDVVREAIADARVMAQRLGYAVEVCHPEGFVIEVVEA